jgi:hypothetical protein
MLRKKATVGINRVRAPRALPVAILAKLRNARTRLRHQLALRMPLNELTVSLDRVGRFRRAPILLFAAAPRHQQQ